MSNQYDPETNEMNNQPEQAEPAVSGQTEQAAPQQEATFGSGEWQWQPADPELQSQKKKKKGRGKKIVLGTVAVLLAAVICFGAGYAGVTVGSMNRAVIIQQTTGGTADVPPADASQALSSRQVAAKVESSVVAITTEQMTTSNLWFGNYVTSGAGSGVIISEDGYILTCAHVINGASKITVELSNGEKHNAQLVGSYVEGDIAVVKIDVTGLNAAAIADSDALQQGETCYAVGNPEGRFSGSISNGIVSALNRTISVQVEGAPTHGSLSDMFFFGPGAAPARSIRLNVIQMTAAVSPGNSGGALFNDRGELIGIVSAKSSDSDSEGLGFAIPSNTAMEIATQLIANGKYEGEGIPDGPVPTANKAVLGITVSTITPQQASQYNMVPGIYVSEVQAESTKEAGLAVGDRIVSIDGHMVSSSNDLVTYLSGKKPADVVELNVERGGLLVEVSVTLIANPASADK